MLCYLSTVAVEHKYDWGARVRGCKEADYLCEASACNGQKLGGGPSPPSSAASEPKELELSDNPPCK